MTDEYKADPQIVIEFMFDKICHDNGATGKIEFEKGLITIIEDGEVWESKGFIREYDNGYRI